MGSVSWLSLNPVIMGLPLAIAACTDGSFNEAAWLSLLSQTSRIQMAF
jgi:hypothetical protein